MALKQASLFDFVDEPPVEQPQKEPATSPEEVVYDETPPPAVQEPAPEENPVAEPVFEVDFEEAATEDAAEIAGTATTKKQGPGKTGRGRTSIADAALEADAPEVPDDETLFSKRYYNIGAVADMFKVNISLIRYWENEFPVLKPKKNGKGDRLFRPEDIKNLQLIYFLLREKKYTIDGARDYFKNIRNIDSRLQAIESLKKIRLFLLELKATL